MKKHNIYFIRFASFFISLVFCFTLVFIYSNVAVSKRTMLSPCKNYLVVIDAGHGGIDRGVVGVNSGVYESDLNLAITKKLQAVFIRSGIEVVLTRKSSGGLYGSISAGHKKRDMQARRDIIVNSNPTIVISIHQNQYHIHSRRGSQVFFKDNDASGHLLANCIQDNLNHLNRDSRGYSALKGDYFILNVSPCPAVIVECGFLSNSQDEKLLISEDYQMLLAESIYSGVMQYVGSGALSCNIS